MNHEQFNSDFAWELRELCLTYNYHYLLKEDSYKDSPYTIMLNKLTEELNELKKETDIIFKNGVSKTDLWILKKAKKETYDAILVLLMCNYILNRKITYLKNTRENKK